MQNYSPRWLLLCFLLIIGCSLSLHVLVFSKRRTQHFEHYQPQVATSGTPAPLARVEGVIDAIGLDRIYLVGAGDSRHPYRCEEPGRYRIGQTVRLTVNEANPPYASHVEVLATPPPAG